MRHKGTIAILAAALMLPLASEAEGGRVRVVRTRAHPRARVTVHAGFPIHRTLPAVVVRPGGVVRVAPRVYLAPVAFAGITVAALPPATARVWTSAETLEREDEWTDFTMNVDRRGKGLLLDISHGAAQISFAEVVFENGEAQVVDFNDRVHASGVYSMMDFKDGRKVDHVRIVAKASSRQSTIRLYLVQ